MRRPTLALLLGCLLLVAGVSALDGYEYYQTIEYAGCDQEIYQQDIVIHRSAGTAYNETSGGLETWHIYVGDHCLDDYGDVRFTNSTGAELAYYLWPDYDSSSARFTVRLEGATSAGTLTVHYGNPSATTASDGGATFQFYDDFSAGLSSDWVTTGTLAKSVSNGILTVSGAGWETGGTLYNNRATYEQCIVQMRSQISKKTTGWYHSGIGLGTTDGGSYTPTNHIHWGVRNTISGHLSAANQPGGSISDIPVSDDFHNFDLVWGADAVRFYCDGALKATHNANTPSIPLYLTIWIQYASGDINCDWILVRAYSAAPPAAIDFSGEQETQGPPIVGFTATPTVGLAPLTVQFNDTSLRSPTSWTWDFGDGSTSTDQNPEHTYTSTGTYTVKLIASHPYDSDEETKVNYITVVTLQPFPGCSSNPTDPDSDGLYEDINGNGRWDFQDLVLFFQHLTWCNANQPITLFDWNSNFRCDFDDVHKLWLDGGMI